MPAPASLQIDYPTIRQHVAQLLGMSREPSDWLSSESDDVDRIINSGLRRFYGEPHEWSFFKIPYAFVTPAAYSAGTIAVAGGIVTLTGGSFPTWAASAWIEFRGNLYEVLTRTNNTSLVLVDATATAAAGTTYNLKQFRFELPADFESADGPLIYHPEQSAIVRSLEDVGFARVRQWYEKTGVASTLEPTMYSIYPKTFNAEVGQRYFLELAPPPALVHRLTLVYRSFGWQLDDTNIYPLGGPAHSETILAAVLAEAERRTFGGAGDHEGRYQEALAKSIARDRKATNAERLGALRNPGFDGDSICDWPTRRRDPIYYNGTEIL